MLGNMCFVRYAVAGYGIAYLDVRTPDDISWNEIQGERVCVQNHAIPNVTDVYRVQIKIILETTVPR